jgi:hypothetical protein
VSRRDEGSEFDSGVMVDGTGGGNVDLGSDGDLITPATGRAANRQRCSGLPPHFFPSHHRRFTRVQDKHYSENGTATANAYFQTRSRRRRRHWKGNAQPKALTTFGQKKNVMTMFAYSIDDLCEETSYRRI